MQDVGTQADGEQPSRNKMMVSFYPSPMPGSMKEYLVFNTEEVRKRYLEYTKPQPVTGKEPKFDQYISFSQRLWSFADWPRHSPISTASLARAGWFYAGYCDGFLDCTKCFQCGVGNALWELNDSPLAEHRRLSPDCPFVKQKMDAMNQ